MKKWLPFYTTPYRKLYLFPLVFFFNHYLYPEFFTHSLSVYLSKYSFVFLPHLTVSFFVSVLLFYDNYYLYQGFFTYLLCIYLLKHWFIFLFLPLFFITFIKDYYYLYWGFCIHSPFIYLLKQRLKLMLYRTNIGEILCH